MTSKPERQYLRRGLREQVWRTLERLPNWTGVRFAGHDPRQIESVEQLLTWLDGYVKVVEEIKARLVTQNASRVKIANRYEELAQACRRAGLDPDKMVTKLTDLGIDEARPPSTPVLDQILAEARELGLVWCGTPDHPPTPHPPSEECLAAMLVTPREPREP